MPHGVNERVWDKAKTASLDSKPDNLYALSMHIYKKMVVKESEAGKSGKHAYTRDELAKALYQATYGAVVKREASSISTTPALSRESTNADAHIKPMGDAPGGVISGSGKRFRVVLIKEGMGNLGDCYYYTKEALEQSVADKIFEGKKCYIDHPSESEDQDRPERSVRDVIGYFQNVAVETEEDRTVIAADLMVIEGASYDQARFLIIESLKYAQNHPGDLVGLSINASGDAEEIAIEEFPKQVNVPSAAKEKVNQARAKGALTVKVVKQIQSSVSVDLVTEAGAGGRIVKMLEGAKMAKQIEAEEKKNEAEEKKEAEEGKKESEESEEGKKEAEEKKEADEPEKEEPAKADDGTDDHDDADQDKTLIKKMLKKHLGDDEHDEADMEACKEAHKGAIEAGFKGDEAEKAACYSMKMAKHFKQKKKSEEKKESEEAAAKEAEEKKEASKVKLPPGGTPGLKKESDVVALTAENAKLKESLRVLNAEKALEKLLRESGLSMAVTKEFRKLVEGVKSEKEITDKFKVFSEAYRLGGEAVDGFGFAITTEKTEMQDATKELSFGDCVNE